uniref:ATP synthase epsilon chain, chloroplastic n=1 Tax=Euglenaformis proxima TaxID=299110 RepID=A0A023HHY2_9EUGL|nr:ATPase epsilon subunit [Euglenaformis proxima]AGL12028.1 ATPase epsilon subunit [Euglenaformis proxima]
MSLEMSIIIPNRIFLKDTVKEIILPTLTGQIGILNNHIPLFTGLDVGVISIRSESSSTWVTVVVTGGFALVNNNKITILVNEAEFGTDINYEEAEKSFNKAKESLQNFSDNKKKLEFATLYRKAKVRFQVSQKSNK